MDSSKKQEKSNPRDKAGFLSILMFWWTFPIFWKGCRKDFGEEDLCGPRVCDLSTKLGDRLEKHWNREMQRAKENHSTPKFLIAILKTFRWEIIIMGLVDCFKDIVPRLSQPVLLGLMLEYFKPGSNVPKEYAYYYAGGIIATTGLSMFLINQFQFNGFHIGMKLRVACCSLVYRKSLRLSRSALGDTAAGKVVNLLSNDVSRFDILLMFLNQLWLAPLIAIIVMYLLVAETGVPGAVGVIVVFLVVPLQSYTGKLTAVFRRKTAQRTDERIRLMDEIISGIRVIKMYAWEKPFAELIRMARKSEIRIIRKTSFLRGIFMSFNMCTTRLAVFSTLITLVLQGNRLSADRVFVYVSYFNILCFSMSSMFVRAIAEVAEVYVSINRLQEFLLLDEFIKMEKTTNGSLMHKKLTDRDGVSLKNVTAKWNESSSDNTLEKLFLNANKGKLVAIIGQVGSGKSSLLQAILGELPISSGSCLVNGSLSYACQEPWVFAATIRQNIVFGTPFDQKRYDEVVRVCALVRDFEQFPQGDLTLVGERGTSLSGGQKARVNLARAVYNEADIYLLDDPLSAVDTHVGKHLFDECINSYLKHKTRILVTHQLQYLKDADNIVIIKQGQIQMQGSYADLMKSEIDYAKLLGVEELDEIEDIVDYKTEADQENTRLPRILRQFSRMSTRSTQSKVSRRSSIALESEIVELDPPSSDHIEKSSKGKIGKSVYIQYMMAGTNICGFLGVVLMFLLSQGAASGADYWMSYWVTQEESLAYYDQLPDNYTELNQSFVDTNVILIPKEDIFSTETSLFIYTAIIVFLLVITFSRAIIFYVMCMKSSQGLHNSMFNGITKTRMRFFDVNPSGRVLNRFSKDIGSVDEILPKALLDATQILVTALGALVVSVIINYLFIIPVCVIGFICYFIRELYLKISKDLKRLEGITKSPVFTHLNATLQGLSTIRAYKAQDILRNEFDKHQDLHSSAYFLFIGTSVTFGFYLDLFSLIFISLVTFSFLLMEETFGGNVGLAITQSLGLVGLLQWGIRQSAEVSNNMMSVERVLEYKYLEEEPLLESAPDKLPASDWPSKGLIQFEHTSMKYVETDPHVLKDLNITIRPSEKVGIVGRTGAGKSSLISALFRLARVEGAIRIDGIDTKDIGLQDLRSRISIIPQDPVLFSGTLRKNLDPFDHFSDFDLWNALEDVELKDSYDSGDGLRSKVTEGGSNFSVGQRQLICLARAILRNNKILMLDEATANVDPQTDALIQKTIRLKFADCTVLTVAHRLNTIMDSDKVLVMDAGRMVEFDHPYLLLQNKNGHFSKMVQETGKAIVDQLTRIAQEILSWGVCTVHSPQERDGTGRNPRITEHPTDVTVARHEPLTLKCRADGVPTPSVTWYRDGVPLIASGRVVELPDGSLFFLRVAHNRRDTDAGVYWCVARNAAGVARSRNATLSVAVIRDEFRQEPQDMWGPLGGSVVLRCYPPRGHPEPSVFWRKNGHPIDLKSSLRIRLVDPGHLFLQDVHHSDAGRYQCVAKNMAGVRESKKVQLQVFVPADPPMHLEAMWVNATTVYLVWKTPHMQPLNGQLIGYQVTLSSQNALTNMTLGATGEPGLILTNISAGMAYIVRVAAVTKSGVGSYSPPVTFRLEPMSQPRSGDLITETWFIALLSALVTLMVLLFVAMLLVRRRHMVANTSRYKHKYEVSGGASATTVNQPCLVLSEDKLRNECQASSALSPTYAEVYHRTLFSSFQSSHKEEMTTPYATTTLLLNKSVKRPCGLAPNIGSFHSGSTPFGCEPSPGVYECRSWSQQRSGPLHQTNQKTSLCAPCIDLLCDTQKITTGVPAILQLARKHT